MTTTTTLETLLAQPHVQNFGWALIHFAWQGTLVALLLRGALTLLDERAGRARYLACVAALALMLAAPALTFAYLGAGAFDASGGGPASEVAANDGAGETRASSVAPGGAEVLRKTGAGDGARHATASRPFQRWAEDRVTPLLHWLVLAWFAGALLHSLKIFGGWRAAQRLKRQGVRPIEPAWEERLARLRRQMGVRAAVRMCESVMVEVPTVVGWLKPVILVPAGALVGLGARQLEALLAHELAHVRRHDYLVNLLQTFAEAALFYHPAVWWVARQVRAEREHACDDMAVRAVEGGAAVYARALAELEQLRHVGAARQLALAADGGSLLRRVRRLAVKTRAPRKRAAAAPWLAFSAALLAGFAALAGAQNKQTDKASAGESPAALRGASAAGARREVAVTFMGLPSFRANRDSVENLTRTTKTILDNLAAHDVKAVGFVGEQNLGYVDNRVREARVKVLRTWVEAGHELGNQTHSHMSLYNTPLEEMQADVLRGEETARRLMSERGRSLRYFSYPYLNTGSNPETKKAFEQFLKERGYRVHPVTIDSWDWLFASVHQEALRRGDTETMQRVAAEYVPYMERVMEFYEQLSRDVVGREIPQVLMLTTSPVVADQMDEILTMLKRRGYRFVTLEEATKDEAYSQPDTYTGEMGISWIQRWAITRGGEFRQEPSLPTYMRQFNHKNLVPAGAPAGTDD